ncbi:MAG: DUF1844 domain-containing protein [Deltaproteobacteria bacterium]|nr:DUF1844 domain-containing protein [Deltaproteobacteria bacterium]
MDDKDFKVVDKRRFAETGETQGIGEETEKPQDAVKTQDVPCIDFPTFILSLSTSALLHLGEIPDPQTQKTTKNLELAKHTIDMIDMLKQKTKGNLAEAEARLIDNMLYDLRMRYVNMAKERQKSEG